MNNQRSLPPANDDVEAEYTVVPPKGANPSWFESVRRWMSGSSKKGLLYLFSGLLVLMILSSIKGIAVDLISGANSIMGSAIGPWWSVVVVAIVGYAIAAFIRFVSPSPFFSKAAGLVSLTVAIFLVWNVGNWALTKVNPTLIAGINAKSDAAQSSLGIDAMISAENANIRVDSSSGLPVMITGEYKEFDGVACALVRKAISAREPLAFGSEREWLPVRSLGTVYDRNVHSEQAKMARDEAVAKKKAARNKPTTDPAKPAKQQAAEKQWPPRQQASGSDSAGQSATSGIPSQMGQEMKFVFPAGAQSAESGKGIRLANGRPYKVKVEVIAGQLPLSWTIAAADSRGGPSVASQDYPAGYPEVIPDHEIRGGVLKIFGRPEHGDVTIKVTLDPV